MNLTMIWDRIYADFFMPSHFGVFREFLKQIITSGYHICSVDSYWKQINNVEPKVHEKYVVLRHDVDSDLVGAKAMWQIEKALGIKSSYYFRLSTIDISLMREIELSGGEASYHFEELATIAKQKRLRSREAVLHEMSFIREMFKRNLNSLREKSGLPMKIVAAHGDFINRKLKIYNWEILKDDAFRKDVGVELEVYDEAFMSHVTSCHSEVLMPHMWEPEHPVKAAEACRPIIYVLVHPGNWRANPRENLLNDIRRAWEGISYSWC
jgi:hypothetical protein